MTAQTAPLKPLRLAMPLTTAWLDALRAVFGEEGINAAIRAGMAGYAGFWASEGGHEVGTRPAEPTNAITAAQMVIVKPKPKENKR